MLALRKFWTVVLEAWSVAFLVGAVLKWGLDLDDGWVLAGSLAGAIGGGLLGVEQARRLPPIDEQDRRDTIVGWGGLIGAVAAVACLFLPFPWGVLGAAVVIVAIFAVLRRVTGEPRAG